MTIRNVQNIVYSLVFFLLGLLSYLRGESIPLITSFSMSAVFAVIYLILKYDGRNEEMACQADNVK
jgi:hypothetical protein